MGRATFGTIRTGPHTSTMTSTRDDWTPGEARMWARRLRKVGFSPVSLHFDTDESAAGNRDGWYLRCNWPYDIADLPLDLLPYFLTVDRWGEPERYSLEHIVEGREPARRLLAVFRAVRLGMGSRPIPVAAVSERQFTTTTRLHQGFDWRRGAQRHPDYHPDKSMAPRDPQS